MEITDLHRDPIAEFEKWFALAKKTDLPHPNSMALATASKDGKPSVRVVLLKEVDESGFVFYTNFESRKGDDLEKNPFAALGFHWDVLRRQIRIEGSVERVSDLTSETYFQSRPRESCLAAWASEQSKEIPDRMVLEKRFDELRKKFENQKIPLPPFWGGYRVIPEQIEFWIEAPNRMHDRFCYQKQNESIWSIKRLAP
ncbi:MAG: pyridoxamine 5'-phosphate oxidase [SAR324 cluster bacterium]|nr:pyridoxamine 5'-phosphate oxidase [SAR324 cluster bacterium]